MPVLEDMVDEETKEMNNEKDDKDKVDEQVEEHDDLKASDEVQKKTQKKVKKMNNEKDEENTGYEK